MTTRGEARRRHRSEAARASGEAGETLIEVLATVILMGLVIVGLLTGIITVIQASDHFNKSSRSNLAIHQYAEALKDPIRTRPYKPCANTTDYAAFSGLPSGYSAVITKVEIWKGASTSNSLTWVDQTAGCLPAEDKGLQRLSIKVTSPTPRGDTETLTLVKRDARCLVSYDNPDGKPC